MIDLFETVCGEIVRRKYPNYPTDSWGENWVDTLKNTYGKNINDCSEIFVVGFNYGHRCKEFKIWFCFDDIILHFNSDGYGWFNVSKWAYRHTADEYKNLDYTIDKKV
jgi:hypothetical protein